MTTPPVPHNEAQRLEALYRYDILDTAPEREYDDLTFLASQICGTPIAMITFIDPMRQWFKSRIGLDRRETPREEAFCAYAIHEEGLFVVPDAANDARFATNPLVRAEPRLRFYAGAPLRTRDGHGLGTVCVMDRVARDLSDQQRRALEALARQVVTILELRHRNVIFRALIENSPAAAFLKDAAGRYLYVNSGWTKSFGRGAESPIGKTAVDWYPGEMGQRIHQSDLDALATRKTVETIDVIHPPRGEEETWLTLRFPTIDVRGRQILGGVGIDVTRAMRAEEQLRESELKFRTVCTSAPDAIVTSDRYGEVVFWNQAAEKIFGFTETEMLGSPFTLLIPEQDQAQQLTKLLEARWHANPQREFLARRKDGNAIPVEIAVSKWHAGGESFYTAIIRDLTERKQTEAQLEQARRTESLGRLAATVAHEFNNVLMGATPFVSVLQKYLANEPKAQKALDNIARSMDRGKNITQQILRYGRPAEPERKSLDLAVWLKQLVPELESLAGERISTEVDIPNESLPVLGDGSQLEQVVTNIVANARDAIRENGRIRVALRRVEGCAGVEDRRAYAHLSIEDNGAGMSPEVLRNVFEPMFTTKRVGTGLGLAVAQRVIEKHQGIITVKSEPGRGTTFHIYIPLAAF